MDERNMLYVELNKIRGIDNLKINMSLNPGIYAVTGMNGIGKSTLFTYISPIFADKNDYGFLKTEGNSDSYIVFRFDGKEEKWTHPFNEWVTSSATPLNIAGYYEGGMADGLRFRAITNKTYRRTKGEPFSFFPVEDITKERMGLILRDDANYYQELCRINKYFYIQKNGYRPPCYLKIGEKYISQNQFSAGEYVLTNLLQLLNNLILKYGDSECPKLFLIDEVELALHPVAIRRLLSMCTDLAAQYNIAFYFSTHSIEIINSIPRENLIYLYKGNLNEVICDNDCYPAFITKDINYFAGYDYLILVEDIMAKMLVEQYIRAKGLRNKKMIEVLPVGGGDQVLSMHENILKNQAVYSFTKIISILDGDKEIERASVPINWPEIDTTRVMYLPVQSVEKYLLEQTIRIKNPAFLAKMQACLYPDKATNDWFEADYNREVDNWRTQEIEKIQNNPHLKEEEKNIKVQAEKGKNPWEYKKSGKALNAILMNEYKNKGGDKSTYIEKLCSIVFDMVPAPSFVKALEEQLAR